MIEEVKEPVWPFETAPNYCGLSTWGALNVVLRQDIRGTGNTIVVLSPTDISDDIVYGYRIGPDALVFSLASEERAMTLDAMQSRYREIFGEGEAHVFLLNVTAEESLHFMVTNRLSAPINEVRQFIKRMEGFGCARGIVVVEHPTQDEDGVQINTAYGYRSLLGVIQSTARMLNDFVGEYAKMGGSTAEAKKVIQDEMTN